MNSLGLNSELIEKKVKKNDYVNKRNQLECTCANSDLIDTVQASHAIKGISMITS